MKLTNIGITLDANVEFEFNTDGETKPTLHIEKLKRRVPDAVALLEFADRRTLARLGTAIALYLEETA